jgi:4-hydroxy-2-oxoglutarate aldolase
MGSPGAVSGSRLAGGIVCPIATPVLNGQFRPETFRRHVDWLGNSIDGLLVLGSSGELASLPTRERREVGSAVETLPERLVVYMGVGEASTARAIEELSTLPARADYAAVTAPYYFAATSQRALVDHFKAVADASPRPVILYNLPQNTGVAISAETVQELANHPNIRGIKDSSGDTIEFSRYLDIRPPGFLVFQGREQLAAASMWLGADGIISALANFAPEELQRLMRAVRGGNDADARAQQRRVTALSEVFAHGHWVAALKAALVELGIDVGDPIPPLQACTADERARIREVLGAFNIPRAAQRIFRAVSDGDLPDGARA